MKATSLVLAGMSAILILGCQRGDGALELRGVRALKTSSVVAEFHVDSERIVLETNDEGAIGKIEAWLEGVCRRQPPPNEIGAILPWCTLELVKWSSGHRGLVEYAHVYSSRGGSDPQPLLSAEEKRELLALLDAPPSLIKGLVEGR